MPRHATAAVLLLVLSCAACSKPKPPPTDEPPEPRARDAAQATGLRDAIQQPIDRAKAVEGAVRDAAAQQQAEIDAQTGG